jgi:hypothetical protein
MSTDTTPVTLPPGCYGIKMESDGREFNAKPGGSLRVPDEYASELAASNAGRNGIISVGLHATLGTKRGRVCTRPGCHFRAQAWSLTCPRLGCGAPTREEMEDDNLRTVRRP